MCTVTFDWEQSDAKEKVKYFEKKKSVAWAVIELTSVCNFNCMWCYASSGNRGKHMEWNDLTKVMKIFSDSGVRQITFSGGEPTLYPYIKDAIKLAKEYDFIIHMNTNGYLFTKELAREFKTLGLSQVQINIDSIDSEKHDKIRGKKGSFKRANKALKNAKEVGITPVSQTVLTKLNENEIFDIFKLARGLGVKRCRTWDMMPVGFAKGKTDLRPTNFIETLKKLDEFTYNLGAKYIESGDPFFPLDYKTKLEVYGGYCPGIRGGFLTVSFDGSVFSCSTQRDSLFNIFTFNGNFKGIFKEKVEERYNNIPIPLECEGCKFKEMCRGGCPTRRAFVLPNKDYTCSS